MKFFLTVFFVSRFYEFVSVLSTNCQLFSCQVLLTVIDHFQVLIQLFFKIPLEPLLFISEFLLFIYYLFIFFFFVIWTRRNLKKLSIILHFIRWWGTFHILIQSRIITYFQ